jgi:hypothetical protein
MKVLLGLLVMAIGFLGGVWLVKSNPLKKANDTTVEDRRILITMASAEVVRRRGHPAISEKLPDGSEVWTYRDGTVAMFRNGRVIETSRQPEPPPPAKPAPSNPGKK